MQPRDIRRDMRKRLWDVFSPIVLKIVVGLLVESVVVAVLTLKYLPDAATAMTAISMEQILVAVEEDVFKYIVEITALSAIATMPFLMLMRQSDRRKETLAGIVQNNKAPLSKYIYIICISIAFSLGLNNIMLLSDLANYSLAYQEAAEALYAPSLAVQLNCLGIITPIMEEYIFRGLIFKRIRNYFSARRAIVASAFFFGMYHGNLVQVIYGTLSGLLLGYLYEKYGSLKAPILAHMLMNIVSCILTEADVFSWMFSESVRVTVITAACAAIASTMYLFISRIEEKPATPDGEILQDC